MKRAKFNIFSLSFLDIICCSLGAMLVVLMLQTIELRKHEKKSADLRLSANNYANSLLSVSNLLSSVHIQHAELSETIQLAWKSNVELRTETELKKESLVTVLSNTSAELVELGKVIRKQEREQKRLSDNALASRHKTLGKKFEVQKLEKKIKEFRNGNDMLGLRVKEKKIVFLIDCSGSMENSNKNVHRLKDVKGAFKVLFASIQDKGYLVDVIAYNGEQTKARWDRLVPMNPNARKQGIDFVSKLKAKGKTPTVKTLKRAFSYPGVEAVVLLSDGEPTDFLTGNESDTETALQKIIEFNKNNIPVYCVGVGGEMRNKKSAARNFMENLAEKTKADVITF